MPFLGTQGKPLPAREYSEDASPYASHWWPENVNILHREASREEDCLKDDFRRLFPCQPVVHPDREAQAENFRRASRFLNAKLGGDISRGVVYQHAPNLQIHITINTTSIEPRRGKGNLPYVFSACGLVYLEDPTEEDDLEAEDRTAQLDPETWNEPENAFAKYYRQHTLLPFAFTEEAAASSSASASASLSSPSRSVLTVPHLQRRRLHLVPPRCV
ncbi:hypothetical protein B0H14DRAFT_3498168 [Mycena olivaceomarginata]|nr:hypothetical protein B0H14DRAFT_3498168 [Mycena olivaceomarginata]